MRIKLLGTAAGGAFPQWNCACRNCRSLRKGSFAGKPRSQLQVAISQNDKSWYLLNASPDIRSQLERDPVFYPRRQVRSTPIAGIVLTSADLDQVLGLLTLREFEQFRIYATPTLQRILREDNSMFAALNRVPGQVTWVDIAPGERFSLVSKKGEAELCCTPVPLKEHAPSYISHQRRLELKDEELLLGLTIETAAGRRLGYFPAICEISQEIMKTLAGIDVILFDGTFWSNNELQGVRATAPMAREIGHLPVSGAEGSLERLAGLKARKIYVHVNNTNPLLNEAGREYRQVRAAGWEVAEDGWEFEL